MPLRLATRGSPLARWQADWVAAALRPTVDVELVIVDTVGDRRQDVPLHVIGGQGVFVKEVQAAVLEGWADAAVHSAKDLPSLTAPGLDLCAIGARDDPRDALIGSTLHDLAQGARVATGSIRRRAQLAHMRPDLEFHDLRGNIGTRLAKASDFDAILVAVAALRRLGADDRIGEALDPEVMIPQVGQGAIAVECRAGDEATRSRLAAIDHRDTRAAVESERAFLAMLGGGCTLPVGAYATVSSGSSVNAQNAQNVQNVPVVSLHAVIASDDGSQCLTHREEGADPHQLGESVARYLLDVKGGRALLQGRT